MKQKIASILCAGVLTCLAVASCGQAPAPPSGGETQQKTPKITAAYQNTDIPCFWGYAGNATFREHLADTAIEEIPYVPLGYSIKITFDKAPENLELIGFPLNSDGSDMRLVPEDDIRQKVELNGKNAEFIFQKKYGWVDENQIPHEKQYPYGYRLTYLDGQEERECYFMLRTDDDYHASAPIAAVTLNGIECELSGVTLPVENGEERLAPDSFTLDSAEQKRAYPICYGDELRFSFPGGSMPDQIVVENDLYSYDTANQQKNAHYVYQETKLLTEPAITRTDDHIALRITPEQFTPQGKDYCNALRFTCTRENFPTYVYLLWFRVS